MKKFPGAVAATTAAAVFAITIAVGAAAFSGTGSPHAMQVRSHLPSTQPSYNLNGVNETVHAYGVWYGTAAQRIAAEAERQRQAVAAAARRSAPRSYARTGGAVNWDGIARCETGSNWQHQTRYDGGLGILHAAWIEFGGREFAEYGSQATREEQIVVAERIHARYGLSGWGCKAYG